MEGAEPVSMDQLWRQFTSTSLTPLQLALRETEAASHRRSWLGSAPEDSRQELPGHTTCLPPQLLGLSGFWLLVQWSRFMSLFTKAEAVSFLGAPASVGKSSLLTN